VICNYHTKPRVAAAPCPLVTLHSGR